MQQNMATPSSIPQKITADIKPSTSTLMSALASNSNAATSLGPHGKPNPKHLYQLTPKLESSLLPTQFKAASSSKAVTSSKVATSSVGFSSKVTSASKIKGSAASGQQDSYAKKWMKIKQVIKDMVFVNGAVCDEVLRTEEKLAKVKEERRFLLRKLLQYQSLNESGGTGAKMDMIAAIGRNAKLSVQEGSSSEHGPKTKSIKRRSAATNASPGINTAANLTLAASSLPTPVGASSDKKRKTPHIAKDLLDSLQGRPKKSKSGGKKVIPPLLLDSLGRPKIPMMLGDVTLHSIGEIIPDRLVFHCAESIFPAGYCITRVYASLHKLDSSCLYTCKISDADSGPLFEIAPEDSSDIVFKANNPIECHNQLIKAIAKSRGVDLSPIEGSALHFFALTHPVIQNLIQSIPGARKCQRYKWIKFEINKSEVNENVAVGLSDPSVTFDAFAVHLESGMAVG